MELELIFLGAKIVFVQC